MKMLESDGHTQRTPVPKKFASTGPLATEPQVDWFNKLREGKDLSSLSEEQHKWLAEADPASIPKLRISGIIEQLTQLKWKPREGRTPTVPDGRYAIPGPDGKLRFYSVKNGHSRTFVDVWASDERWPVKNNGEAIRILNAIKNDPDAGPRFGREIGRCYVCGRTLTDELSRELGIGPVCRGDS